MGVIFGDVDDRIRADGLLAAVNKQFARPLADSINFLWAVVVWRQRGAGGKLQYAQGEAVTGRAVTINQ